MARQSTDLNSYAQPYAKCGEIPGDWEIFSQAGRTYPAMTFQLLAKYSAVRQANA
jgi:hypothetical protein